MEQEFEMLSRKNWMTLKSDENEVKLNRCSKNGFPAGWKGNVFSGGGARSCLWQDCATDTM